MSDLFTPLSTHHDVSTKTVIRFLEEKNRQKRPKSHQGTYQVLQVMDVEGVYPHPTFLGDGDASPTLPYQERANEPVVQTLAGLARGPRR